eukprot:5828960-Amphidinium_carterae.1
MMPQQGGKPVDWAAIASVLEERGWYPLGLPSLWFLQLWIPASEVGRIPEAQRLVDRPNGYNPGKLFNIVETWMLAAILLRCWDDLEAVIWRCVVDLHVPGVVPYQAPPATSHHDSARHLLQVVWCTAACSCGYRVFCSLWKPRNTAAGDALQSTVARSWRHATFTNSGGSNHIASLVRCTEEART